MKNISAALQVYFKHEWKAIFDENLMFHNEHSQMLILNETNASKYVHNEKLIFEVLIPNLHITKSLVLHSECYEIFIFEESILQNVNRNEKLNVSQRVLSNISSS